MPECPDFLSSSMALGEGGKQGGGGGVREEDLGQGEGSTGTTYQKKLKEICLQIFKKVGPFLSPD